MADAIIKDRCEPVTYSRPAGNCAVRKSDVDEATIAAAAYANSMAHVLAKRRRQISSMGIGVGASRFAALR